MSSPLRYFSAPAEIKMKVSSGVTGKCAMCKRFTPRPDRSATAGCGFSLRKNLVRAVLVLCMFAPVCGQVSMKFYEADGVTPFEGEEVMVGTELTIIVRSETGGFWHGGVFMTGLNRAYGLLSGRGFDPNSEDWTGSHLAAAGDNAYVGAYRDSWIWGFDLCTDSSAEAGDWFIIDYLVEDIGDPNVGFYEYHISWDDPNFLIDLVQIPTRDFNDDDTVNLIDYTRLSAHWQVSDCNEPNWCDLTDINRDGDVDLLDVELFTEYWLWALPGPGEMGRALGGGPNETISDPHEPDKGDPKTPTDSYIVTVGKDTTDARVYDYASINAAIAALEKLDLETDRRGTIHVYPGVYEEQLNDFYPGGHKLPRYCDLIGMGPGPGDVVLRHQRRSSLDPDFTDMASEIYAYGIHARGDNVIANMTISNAGPNQNSLLFAGAGTLDNCVVDSGHDAVTAWGDLTMTGCTIKGNYRPCIHAFGTFAITETLIQPGTSSWGGQHPAGIQATKSGTIDHVTIQAAVASSDYEPHYDTPWLAGVITQLANPADTVTITDTSIDLTLTTLFHDDRPGETADWELFGVVSGGRNPTPTTYYPGKTIIRDCQINLVGIEDSSHPNGDGRAIMAAGACIQGGGEMEIRGNTSISTGRTGASHSQNGYEYSLNNQNGVLLVEQKTVTYDEQKTNGLITLK